MPRQTVLMRAASTTPPIRLLASMAHRTVTSAAKVTVTGTNTGRRVPVSVAVHSSKSKTHLATAATKSISSLQINSNTRHHNNSYRSMSTSTTTTSTTHFGYQTVAVEDKQKLVKQVFENVADSYDVMNDVMSAGIHRYWKDYLLEMTHLGPIARAIRQQAHTHRLNNVNAVEVTDVPAPTLRILDVAGGTGDVAFRFVDAAGCVDRAQNSGLDEVQVTVCDINPDMLRVGKDRAMAKYGPTLLENGSQALSFVEGNAQDLHNFPDEQFDLYTIAFGLRNVTDVDAALREAYRVLKPGGRYMCLEFSQVEHTMLRQIYDLYSFNVIPELGHFVANDRDSYQYLVESIRQFSTQPELVERMKAAGFENAQYTDLSGGMVAIHQGWKLLE
jgi:ubiquinone/menaquinone biosynthesis methyltransferase